MDFSFMSNMGAFTVILVTLPFLILVIVFFYIALRGRRASRITRTWPTTTGRVLRSEVELRRSSNAHGGYSSSYYPAVLYEYQVMGQRYQSTTLSPGLEYGLGFRSRVQARVDKYPVSSMVTVYYNPDNPAQAVLEHSATGNQVMGWVALLILLMLACTVGIMVAALGFAGQFANQLMGQFLK